MPDAAPDAVPDAAIDTAADTATGPVEGRGGQLQEKGTEMIFEDYARYYDLYYEEKDYTGEVDAVLNLARDHMRGAGCSEHANRVLDMGCGTGRHLRAFLARGMVCDGFDASERMLASARERLAGTNVGLHHGDLVNFRNGERYDIVVSLFAVMGYLTDNRQLVAGLETAARHLNPGGVFVFDGWFGPAVLSERPEARRHEYTRGADTIVRRAVPELDPVEQVVTVRYEVTREREGQVIDESVEEHTMRYFFVQEMALAFEHAGLQILDACPTFDHYESLGLDTWNVAFVAGRYP